MTSAVVPGKWSHLKQIPGTSGQRMYNSAESKRLNRWVILPKTVFATVPGILPEFHRYSTRQLNSTFLIWGNRDCPIPPQFFTIVKIGPISCSQDTCRHITYRLQFSNSTSTPSYWPSFLSGKSGPVAAPVKNTKRASVLVRTHAHTPYNLVLHSITLYVVVC
jgi:hypothetical protein